MNLYFILTMEPCLHALGLYIGPHMLQLSSVSTDIRLLYLKQTHYKPPLSIMVLQESFFPVTAKALNTAVAKLDVKWASTFDYAGIKTTKILKIASMEIMWQPLCKSYLDIGTHLSQYSDKVRSDTLRLALLRFKKSAFEDKYDVYYCRCIVEALTKLNRVFDLSVTYSHGANLITATYNKDFGYFIIEPVKNYQSVPLFYYISHNLPPLKVDQDLDLWNVPIVE